LSSTKLSKDEAYLTATFPEFSEHQSKLVRTLANELLIMICALKINIFDSFSPALAVGLSAPLINVVLP